MSGKMADRDRVLDALARIRACGLVLRLIEGGSVSAAWMCGTDGRWSEVRPAAAKSEAPDGRRAA